MDEIVDSVVNLVSDENQPVSYLFLLDGRLVRYNDVNRHKNIIIIKK